MELMVSIMALGISLAALWMAGSAMKRSDGDMTSFLLNARKELGSTRSEIDQKVSAIGSRVDTLDKLVAAIQNDTGKSLTSTKSLQTEISGLRSDLALLDESIPKQYRHPTPRTGRPQVTQ